MEAWQIDRGDGKPFELPLMKDGNGTRVLSDQDERMRAFATLKLLNDGPGGQITPEDLARYEREMEEQQRQRERGAQQGQLPSGADPTPTAAHVGAVGDNPDQVLLQNDKAQSYKQDREAVKRVQAMLEKAGYELGEVDGKFGPKTEAALKAFQKDHPELGEVDGKLTARDLQKLNEVAEGKGQAQQQAQGQGQGQQQQSPRQQQQGLKPGADKFELDDLQAAVAKTQNFDVAAFKQRLEAETGIKQSAGATVDGEMLAAVKEEMKDMPRAHGAVAHNIMREAGQDDRAAQSGAIVMARMDAAMQQAKDEGIADKLGDVSMRDVAHASRALSGAARTAERIGRIFS